MKTASKNAIYLAFRLGLVVGHGTFKGNWLKDQRNLDAVNWVIN